FGGAEGAALVMLGDGVRRLPSLGREHRVRVGLGIVLRAVAEALGVRVVVPRTLIARHAVNDLVADVGVLEPDANELRVVARADPNRQPAFVDGFRSEVADARAQDADPVLVGIKAGERLAKGLADTVAAVRPRHGAVVDLLRARVKADRVIARREYNAFYAG